MFDSYLFFDTETGGLDVQEHSLLSMGLLRSDGSKVLASTEIFIRHEPYVVSAGGLEVNRINLVQHHKKALNHPEAAQAFWDFVNQHFAQDRPVTLVGHNIPFDHAFLARFFQKMGQSIEPRISHRCLDTHGLAAYLRDLGKLPLESLSSTKLFEYFGIRIPEDQRHTALGDALATHELYLRLLELSR